MTIESIRCTCSRYPNQFEGVVDGKTFYFRARHGEWRLDVYEGAETDGRTVAEGCADDEPDGGWEPADAEVFVRKQLDAYSAGKCSHCDGTGRSRPAQNSNVEKP